MALISSTKIGVRLNSLVCVITIHSYSYDANGKELAKWTQKYTEIKKMQMIWNPLEW